MGREGWKNCGAGRIPWACELLKGMEVGPAVDGRGRGGLGSPGIGGAARGREVDETAEPERACLAAELDALPPRGVVESPTVDKDEGSWEGR